MLSSDLALSEKMDGDVDTKKRIPGSIAFVPAVAGLILAGEVIKDILRTGRDSDYDI